MCMCVFCNVCGYVGFVMCVCVYVCLSFVMCVCVCMCGFSNVCVL